MKLILIILFFVAVIVCLLLLRKYGKLEFVSHAKLLWKTWSIWLGTAATAFSGYLAFFPDAIREAWNSVPPDMKGYLPSNVLMYIGAIMMGLAVVSQFIRQRKLNAQLEELKNVANRENAKG
ncbi:hypothetical protein AH03_28 [Erwinia phage AH03]|uniref:Holin n=1 Tax=Erwinia phage AH03 TaxID=2869568 RepID=A0AAE8BQ70_9CAUD|nr:hypothetical protein AH03_28 [Erwinia phage AH03]